MQVNVHIRVVKVFSHNHHELERYIPIISITASSSIYLQSNTYFPDEIKSFTLLEHLKRIFSILYKMYFHKSTAIYIFVATAAWISAVYADCKQVLETPDSTGCAIYPYQHYCYKKATKYYVCCTDKQSCDTYQWV